MTTYVLRPAPPLRSYLVAAILAALGALMVVGSGLGKNPWLLVFGALVLADGLVLVLMTTISAYRARVAVDLDENGYVIHSREGDVPVSYTHLRAHETRHDLVCRLLLE